MNRLGSLWPEGWARQVFGEPDVEAQWRGRDVTRPGADPVAAWRMHMDRLDGRLSAQRAGARLAHHGPGKLEIGLFTRSRFCSVLFRTMTAYVATCRPSVAA
jgi:hypothetical protein